MKRVRKRKGPPTTTSTRPKSSARPNRRPKRKKSTRPGGVAYLGLGSNLGNRRANLEAALDALAALSPVRVSSFYLSDPVGYADQPAFFNAVARMRWTGTPRELLSAVKGIEKRLGRVPTFRNGPRVIDIDLLDVGGAVRRRPYPVLPHPRLEGRRFVLAPLAEIAPRWRHP
ncbi:MAG TPA: 2-amino-4-hydroxy-6-hydroxymethyldihydropteridine diphosphokinase, partial [Thermoanaerobaculia bacterium]